MAELSQEILSELEVIKWLLIVLVVIGLYFSYVFFAVSHQVTSESGSLRKQLQHKKREADFEEMLAKGDATGAKFAGLEWTNSYPNEPRAHWYLARAYEQLGDYLEAKKTLRHLQTINPSWNSSIEPWLESIEEHLVPKSVE
jgi:tetratricopeptide (TPR) repeat protein